METRTIEINLISAKDLKDVNFISKMEVYTVVYLTGDSSSSKQKTKTKVDHEGGTNPTWNFPMKFTINESLAQQNRQTLVFKLKCDRILGDKDIGEVNVPVNELLGSNGDASSMQFVSYQVRKPSGKPQGVLNFSYKLCERVESKGSSKADHQPVMAYPAPGVGPSTVPYGGPSAPDGPGIYPPPPVAAGYGYPPPPPPPYGGYPPPPPPPGYGYPPPPPPGYGYPPPPPPGYGYPAQGGYGYPPVQQPPKKNKFGMGLGAGLLGGVLGGLLIGDMVSDFGDGGCDGGF